MAREVADGNGGNKVMGGRGKGGLNEWALYSIQYCPH